MRTRITSSQLKAVFAYMLGFVTGILLLIVEKDDYFVRFHAMQSTIVFGGIYIVMILVYDLPVLGGLFVLGLRIVAVALWIFLISQTYRGRIYKLPYIGTLSEQQIGKSL